MQEMTCAEKAAWMASLEAGSKVAIKVGYSMQANVMPYRVGTVARKTPTGRIVVKNGTHLESFNRLYSADSRDFSHGRSV